MMPCAFVVVGALLASAPVTEAEPEPVFGQAFLAPTAQVQEPGTLVVSSTQLLMLGVSWTFPHDLEANVRWVVPILPDAQASAYGSVKWRFLRWRGLDVAAHGSLLHLSGTGQSMIAGSVNVLASYCLWECRTLISGMLGLSVAGINDKPHLSGVGSLSVQQRLGPASVYLLGELTASIDTGFGAAEPVDGQGLFLGLRFAGTHADLDLGVMVPLAGERALNAYFTVQGDAPAVAWMNLRYRYTILGG